MIDLTPYTDSNGDIDLKKELIQKLAGIVESGSNNDGYYVKFEDGTMIQSNYIVSIEGISPTSYTNQGINLYRGGPPQQTFPLPFVGFPSISFSGDAGINQMGTRVYDVTSTQAGIQFISMSNFSRIDRFGYIAIGRWK